MPQNNTNPYRVSCPYCGHPDARSGPRGIVCPKCNPVEYQRLFRAPTLRQVGKAYEAGARPEISQLARPGEPPALVRRRPPMVKSIEILRWLPETKELDVRIKFD